MANLIFVRHGQSTYNLENRFTGSLDVPLTPLGEEEAKLAGEKIMAYSNNSALFKFNRAYTSMLKRAQESLRIILEEIGQTQIPIIINAALDERMYGSLQGLNKAETAEKYGAAQVEIWRRSYATRPPNGESLKDTYNRMIPFYKTEIEPKLKLGENILIVAHGNSLRALLMYLENKSPEEIEKINIPTGIPRLYILDKNLEIESVEYF